MRIALIAFSIIDVIGNYGMQYATHLVHFPSGCVLGSECFSLNLYPPSLNNIKLQSGRPAVLYFVFFYKYLCVPQKLHIIFGYRGKISEI